MPDPNKPGDKTYTFRGDDGSAPYPLGGDILVRAVRSLSLMQGVGVDQSNRQTNQFGLDPRIGYQAQLLDASVAPFRNNGRSFRAQAVSAAGGAGNASFIVLINAFNSNVIAVLDGIEVTLSAAAAWTLGYSPLATALVAAATTVVTSLIDVEAVNFPTRPPTGLTMATGNGGFGASFDPAWNPFLAGQGVAANSPPIIETLGDVVLYPGWALVLISSAANIAISANWRGRAWKMGQGITSQLFG